MNINTYYWYYPQAIESKTCDKIIQHCKKQKSQKGLVGSQEKRKYKEIKNVRDSEIAWVNDAWLYELINPFIHQANKNAGWNFDWDWNESIQFTKYKLNQFYDWHIDTRQEPYNDLSNPNFHQKIRKLSSVILLSDSKDFVGGDFKFQIFDYLNGKVKTLKVKEMKKKGSMIVFPSFIRHKVEPVKKGVRYSLVNWSLGYPFK